jgi:hypothetical protein
MYYHYNKETKEFLFESLNTMKEFPSTKIDIHFNLPKNRNQVFDGEKWLIVYDYRYENVYKKNSLNKIYKKLGEKINEDEIIYENDNPIIKKETSDEEIKTILKLKINSFLASTDKYFNNHPPKYKHDIEKLKKYREYLYEFTEKNNWWNEKIIDFDEFQH